MIYAGKVPSAILEHPTLSPAHGGNHCRSDGTRVLVRKGKTSLCGVGPRRAGSRENDFPGRELTSGGTCVAYVDEAGPGTTVESPGGPIVRAVVSHFVESRE